MTVDPAIFTALGRTCVIVTAKSRSRISIPTPVPKASSVRISIAGKLIPPCVVVPTHDVIRGIVTRRHHLDHGADAPAHIRQLTVLQPPPRRRPQREDRVAAGSQAPRYTLRVISDLGIGHE